MNSLIPLLAAALLLSAQHHPMPPGISHEEHLKQMQKDEALKKRGAETMGFDQDATTHHFRLSPSGGSIEVTVNNTAHQDNLSAIRSHLRAIASEFARGQFDKPFAIHGEVLPGISEMEKNAAALAFTYEDVPGGGAVRIDTTEPRLIEAVHLFLRYQITEHHTGDPLEVKR
jgi:hypothetical protein